MTAAPLLRLYREWLRRVRVEGRYDDRLFLGRAEIAAWALDGHAPLAAGSHEIEKETDPHVPVGTVRPAAPAGR